MGVKRGGGVGAGFVSGVWLKAGAARMIDSDAMSKQDRIGNGLLLGIFTGHELKTIEG